ATCSCSSSMRIGSAECRPPAKVAAGDGCECCPEERGTLAWAGITLPGIVPPDRAAPAGTAPMVVSPAPSSSPGLLNGLVSWLPALAAAPTTTGALVGATPL